MSAWVKGACLKTSMIIGIGGGTGSGKTTLAKKLLASIGADHVVSLQQDSYYRNLADMPLDQRSKANFDHPDAYDNALLFEHLKSLRAGESVRRPIYDYVTHSRKPESICVAPLPVILVEGILVFFEDRMRQLMDMKIFVDCDADIRFTRRLMRDIQERGRSVESVIDQYVSTVRPMHLEFVAPSRRYADVILSGERFNDRDVEFVTDKIRSFLKSA